MEEERKKIRWSRKGQSLRALGDDINRMILMSVESRRRGERDCCRKIMWTNNGQKYPNIGSRYAFLDLESLVNWYRRKPKEKKKEHPQKTIELLKTKSEQASEWCIVVLDHRHELTSFVFATFGNFALWSGPLGHNWNLVLWL